MTTPTTPEAVEAVRKWVAENHWTLPWQTCERSFTQPGYWALPEEKLEAASRILAAEVERLRARVAELEKAVRLCLDEMNYSAQTGQAIQPERVEIQEATRILTSITQSPTPLPRPDRPGWLPIETAPKDGTAILLNDHGDKCVAYWWRHGWKEEWTSAPVMSEPTHWMPLPVSPTPATTPEASNE